MADKVRDLAWTTTRQAQRQMTPEGLYGRRKMTALVRRQPGFGDASAGSVDRAMTALGLSGVRRDKGIRTTIPGKGGNRAGDLLDRDFTAPRPDHTWVADFTYVRTWAGFCYVAFIVGGAASSNSTSGAAAFSSGRGASTSASRSARLCP